MSEIKKIELNNSKEVLNFCLKKGLLINKEVLELFNGINDIESIKLVLEKIKNFTQQKIITKDFFYENKKELNQIFLTLPFENQKNLQKLKIEFELSDELDKNFKKSVVSIEVDSEENLNLSKNELNKSFEDVKVLSMKNSVGKKLEVKDFVKYFRSRLSEMKFILQDHAELNNLVSINKISGNRQGISIIGIVSSKKITKNNNILFEIEDLTGTIKVLINQKKENLYKKSEEIALDSVIGFKGSGNSEIFFVNDVVFPDSTLNERKNSFVDESVLFIGDLHIGSKLFLEKNFLKFVDYLNGEVPNTPEVEKIKYLFVVGDLVAGVGNYPGQEKELFLSDLGSHFERASELLGKIRKDIRIIISPGNHDGVRIMEPQPLFDEKYAWPLYDLENVIITTNPSLVNIGSKQGFSGFDVLTYHGFSFPYYAGNISHLIKQKAMHKPELIMSYLLKNRHLAPTHGSLQYFPSEIDPHLIRNIPDIFISGHTHKSGVCYYNNILIVSVSSWESMTGYQEKMGMVPDLCKVPMFNLKTRSVKILDFE